MKAIVIINEQHTLSAQQLELLGKYDYSFFKVPATGWNLQQIKEQVASLWFAKKSTTKLGKRLEVIFVSPIPAMMALCANRGIHFRIFHNDYREKKELPDGKIIMVLSQTGWKIV